jgi:hypothetical protein
MILDKIELVHDSDPEQIRPIRIIEGEFEGLVVRFGRAWFPDTGDNNLSFEVDIIEGTIEKEQEPRLHEFLGQVLMAFIQDEMHRAERNAERNNDKSEN